MEALEYRNLDNMTPREIVSALDRYVIGQNEAKKTIAVALRNRVRRKRLPAEIRDEVSPKNILMIGPTGVGKTEIARRIAKLANAPFIKVEATKYSEIGYVGRDCESMVKDLMGSAVSMVKEEMAKSRENEVELNVENRLLDLLLPSLKMNPEDEKARETREKFRDMLKKGILDDREVEMTVTTKTNINIMGGGSMEDLQSAMSSLSSMLNGQGTHKRRISVRRARDIIREEEMERIVDTDKAVDEARERTQEMGIIFIDEIDKIASRGTSNNTDVSREGVQRDILPIVEGTKVSTKWGVIDTTNILFIAAGAFSVSKPSDLIPELQGRFPLHVELEDLSADDFYRILTEPRNAMTKQYKALLETENVSIVFEDAALKKISEIAHTVNMTNDNIGARRLHTVMEKLLEELSFAADELSGQTITITPDYVDERLGSIVKNQDLSRYIL